MNTNYVLSFFLTKNGKKTKFTTKFDNTFLENCQITIFETSDLYITPLKLTRELILKIDENLLSIKGKEIKKLFLE